ncbi:MAG: hypothetical protein MZW92_42980 [Comamonadaceae bacterium]|nr:hypothetical protein [Comamonadaceae bacterium]
MPRPQPMPSCAATHAEARRFDAPTAAIVATQAGCRWCRAPTRHVGAIGSAWRRRK